MNEISILLVSPHLDKYEFKYLLYNMIIDINAHICFFYKIINHFLFMGNGPNLPSK